MANEFTSNITRKLLRIFLKHFESNRVVTKTINTQLFTGKFTPASGTTVDIKRPHDYTTIRTPGGDISADTKDDIISGKATATVQNYFTSAAEWENVEEALESDQLDMILAPMARRMITDLETDLATFMLKNTGLTQGAVGTGVSAWTDVAEAGALLSSLGVPSDMPWYYLLNPFTQVALANTQVTVSGNLTDSLVRTAWEKAQITQDFGGLRAITSNSLASFTTSALADFTGTLANTPTPTYVAAKDTMQQSLDLTGFTSSLDIVAGTTLEIPTRFLLNQATRLPALDGAGANIPWRGTVLETVTLASGVGTVIVSSPGIFETLGSPVRDAAYNTVTSALTSGDEINILANVADTTFQPNLFYHPQAFSLATVKLPKLFSTDTVVTTEDGFSIRVSKYADGDSNTQKVRFDLLPAYATLNPWFAGAGWG